VRSGQQKGAGRFPFGGGIAGCEQAEVTDADKAVGEDVEEESAEELPGGQADDSVGAGLRVVACPEGDGFSVKGEDALVGRSPCGRV